MLPFLNCHEMKPNKTKQAWIHCVVGMMFGPTSGKLWTLKLLFWPTDSTKVPNYPNVPPVLEVRNQSSAMHKSLTQEKEERLNCAFSYDNILLYLCDAGTQAPILYFPYITFLPTLPTWKADLHARHILRHSASLFTSIPQNHLGVHNRGFLPSSCVSALKMCVCNAVLIISH